MRPQSVPAGVGEKNPGVAAVLSALLPGLGQLYNEEVGKGVLFFVAFALSLAAILLLVGLILAPAVWLLGIYDALRSARALNAAAVPAPPPPAPFRLCMRCGTQLAPGARFCGQCGHDTLAAGPPNP